MNCGDCKTHCGWGRGRLGEGERDRKGKGERMQSREGRRLCRNGGFVGAGDGAKREEKSAAYDTAMIALVFTAASASARSNALRCSATTVLPSTLFPVPIALMLRINVSGALPSPPPPPSGVFAPVTPATGVPLSPELTPRLRRSGAIHLRVLADGGERAQVAQLCGAALAEGGRGGGGGGGGVGGKAAGGAAAGIEGERENAEGDAGGDVFANAGSIPSSPFQIPDRVPQRVPEALRILVRFPVLREHLTTRGRGEGLGLRFGLVVLGYRQRVEPPTDLTRDSVRTAEAESAVQASLSDLRRWHALTGRRRIPVRT
ncbi:hypothetical protein B0H13DRAFT_2275547 [Mycena leptocephala]|nr:hypothetical protein B0H13DRAFT_2275547 [Mycena leptocephala]